jgi:hypothetical protein
VELYRVFDWDGRSIDASEGGPLFVPRSRQGAGRHDIAHYGAWYCSRAAASAVAELLQNYRRHTIHDHDFGMPGGRTRAIVALSLAADALIIDLDDPEVLAARTFRPSQVATLNRTITQRMALSLFNEGGAGISWWSTLEAEWTNVTLFHERALPHTTVAAAPHVLSTRLPEVQLAAERPGIAIDT